MSKSKYKKLSQLKPKDIDDVLYKIYDCQVKNNKDNTFQKIWEDNFCDKFENEELFRKNKNGEYGNPIVKILYDRFHGFFNDKERLKNEFDRIKHELDQIKISKE